MCQNGLVIRNGDSYNEEVFQDYANDQYALHFSNTKDYEDNLLIVVLTNEENTGYYYIAWMGDHIVTDINDMFGDEYTEFGSAMDSCINTSSYKYSLDSNLAQVMETMTQKITDLDLSSSLKCENTGDVMVGFANYTDLPMTEATVEDALNTFAEATGISVVLVVEDSEDVFGTNSTSISSNSISRFFTVGIIVIVVVIALVLILKKRKNSTGYDE